MYVTNCLFRPSLIALGSEYPHALLDILPTQITLARQRQEAAILRESVAALPFTIEHFAELVVRSREDRVELDRPAELSFGIRIFARDGERISIDIAQRRVIAADLHGKIHLTERSRGVPGLERQVTKLHVRRKIRQVFLQRAA